MENGGGSWTLSALDFKRNSIAKISIGSIADSRYVSGVHKGVSLIQGRLNAWREGKLENYVHLRGIFYYF